MVPTTSAIVSVRRRCWRSRTMRSASRTHTCSPAPARLTTGSPLTAYGFRDQTLTSLAARERSRWTRTSYAGTRANECRLDARRLQRRLDRALRRHTVQERDELWFQRGLDLDCRVI